VAHPKQVLELSNVNFRRLHPVASVTMTYFGCVINHNYDLFWVCHQSQLWLVLGVSSITTRLRNKEIRSRCDWRHTPKQVILPLDPTSLLATDLSNPSNARCFCSSSPCRCSYTRPKIKHGAWLEVWFTSFHFHENLLKGCKLWSEPWHHIQQWTVFVVYDWAPGIQRLFQLFYDILLESELECVLLLFRQW
jgi:hypothetical protein